MNEESQWYVFLAGTAFFVLYSLVFALGVYGVFWRGEPLAAIPLVLGGLVLGYGVAQGVRAVWLKRSKP